MRMCVSDSFETAQAIPTRHSIACTLAYALQSYPEVGHFSAMQIMRPLSFNICCVRPVHVHVREYLDTQVPGYLHCKRSLQITPIPTMCCRLQGTGGCRLTLLCDSHNTSTCVYQN